MTGQYRYRLLLLLPCLFLWPALAQAQAESNLLDGKTFTGLNGEKGSSLDPNEAEEIVFANGRFISTTCNRYNFSDAPYTASQVDGAIHFQAVTLSPTHGKIEWQGIVRGEKARMTFTWTKERWYWDTHREYWFEGALKR